MLPANRRCWRRDSPAIWPDTCVHSAGEVDELCAAVERHLADLHARQAAAFAKQQQPPHPATDGRGPARTLQEWTSLRAAHLVAAVIAPTPLAPGVVDGPADAVAVAWRQLVPAHAPSKSEAKFQASDDCDERMGAAMQIGQEVCLVMSALQRSQAAVSPSAATNISLAALGALLASRRRCGAVTVAEFASAVRAAAALAPGCMRDSGVASADFFGAVTAAVAASAPRQVASLLRGANALGAVPGSPEKQAILEVLSRQVYAAGPKTPQERLGNRVEWPPEAAADALIALNAWGAPQSGYPAAAICEALLAMSMSQGSVDAGGGPAADTLAEALALALSLHSSDAVDAAEALGSAAWPHGRKSLTLPRPERAATHLTVAGVADVNAPNKDAFDGAEAVSALLYTLSDESDVDLRECLAALQDCGWDAVAAEAQIRARREAVASGGRPLGDNAAEHANS